MKNAGVNRLKIVTWGDKIRTTRLELKCAAMKIKG